MITNESQVRLSVELQGRLASTGANSSSKRQIRKYEKALKYGAKRKEQLYSEPKYHVCTESVLLNSETVQFFISDIGKVSRCTPSEWKKMSKIKRLEANLQVQADYLSGHSGTKFDYAIID